MTRDDYLHIFRTFWTEEGYAGIAPHLPTWSKSRASNFAHRHGIKMNPGAKERLLSSTFTPKKKPVIVEQTPVNRVLAMRW